MSARCDPAGSLHKEGENHFLSPSIRAFIIHVRAAGLEKKGENKSLYYITALPVKIALIVRREKYVSFVDINYFTLT